MNYVDTDCFHRRCVLLLGRAAWRAPRPEHPVLEIPAGVRSYHAALEGNNSIGSPATGYVRDHRCDAVSHAALDQHTSHNSWHESGVDLDKFQPISAVVHSALRIGRNCALACADLWLGAARLGLGPARDISLGGRAVSSDRVLREDHVRHFAFRL